MAKRFKKQKHLIAYWLKRLVYKQNKPEVTEPPEDWEQRVKMRLTGMIE
jgi:hypothetical protein